MGDVHFKVLPAVQITQRLLEEYSYSYSCPPLMAS
jgi:hypothetical protein